MLNLNKILEPAKTIAIGGHVRPDGDCVGSCMAMYQYIQNNYPDKEVDVFLEEIPSTFYRIKGTDEILHEIDESKHYDLFIVLDCGDTGRLEFSVIMSAISVLHRIIMLYQMQAPLQSLFTI